MPLFGPPNIEKLKAQQKFDRLVEALGYREQEVAEAAAHALEEAGALAVDALIAGLQDRDAAVRALAGEVLGRIGDLRAVTPLIEVLNDPEERVRQAAAVALGYLEDLRAGAPLAAATEDPVEAVRQAAHAALERLQAARSAPQPALPVEPVPVPSAGPEPPPAPPAVLTVILRNTRIGAEEARSFGQQVVHSLLPERWPGERVAIHFELDPDLPADLQSEDRPYARGLAVLRAAMGRLGMGTLDLKERHHLIWATYRDELGGRGVVLIVGPKER